MTRPRRIGRLAIGMVAAAGVALSAAGEGVDGFDLAAAIASAPEGSTVRVPAGTYEGPILVDRSLTLDGQGEAILDGGGEGDVVRITAPEVTLRGFTIRNTGDSLDRENAGVTVTAASVVIEGNAFEEVLFGIYLKEAPRGVIRGNTIRGMELDVARRGDAIRLWYSPGCVVEGNVVRDSRDVVMWFCQGLTVRDNRVTGGRYGLHFMYSDDNTLEGNHLEGNSVGAFLMYSRNLTVRGNVFARNRGPSGYGIGLKDMDSIVAEENLFVGNRVGAYLDNSPWSLDKYGRFERNVFAANDIGLAFMPSVKRNTVVENAFLDNVEQVAVLGGGTFEGNAFNEGGRGNYWSDYAGFDLDEDGVGDVPYRSESLFENLMDREPVLRLFLYSPAQQAIETAAKAFPAVKPRPKFVDEAPLMEPVAVGARLGVEGSGRSMLLASLGLLGTGGLVLLVSRLEDLAAWARGARIGSPTRRSNA